ncbi:MAG: tRNA threonylcarbamoyladenosine dehydratase [Prevotellaceae bacterium]|jgi:tRNA A37 threonylcarbamoyladenosine dehydratase|nr:tRNA threonylcarbamoyladenosine dehydratase [Prevotellaceae bacterium]
MNEHWLTRTEWLLGKEALSRLHQSTVLVAGLGGVGAYAAEMLARAGVGCLILVDNDNISLTNLNRQLPALTSTIGRPKTDVMAERLRDINPQIEVDIIHRYIDESSVNEIITEYKLDFVVDAIDTLSPKIALICAALAQSIPLVSSMGAGAKRDVTLVRLADISKSYNCPLAFMLRKRLRKMGIKKGFPVVFSTELPEPDAIIPCEERNKKSQVGTISYLPAVFGCVCAQSAIDHLIQSI